jgi:putative acetyltransferase
MTTLTIREERPDDVPGIRQIHETAFPAPTEGRLVDELRHAGRLTISLVAVVERQPVGHIGFSPVIIGDIRTGLGLAPLAVLPEFQHRGIGGELVRNGLAACARYGTPFVVVLGEPGYYCRFGFQPAARWNLADEYGGGAAFQSLELVAGGTPEGGLVRYAPEFAAFATGVHES